MTFNEPAQIMAMKKEMEGEAMVELSSKDIAEVKKWQNGKNYEVKLTIKQLSSHLMEGGEVKSKFEIVKANVA